MKSARHQLILLGFLCQGLSWDDYLLPAIYAGLWVLCLRLPRATRVSVALEGVLLVVGCAAGFLLGQVFGRSTHFFLGHGLVLVQAVRLIRPLTRRERLTSLLIALFHVGVACTFLFDLRFVPVLLAALVLIPRALIELAAEGYADWGLPAAGVRAPVLATRPPMRPLRPSWAGLVGIATVMVVFFLVFPRAFLRAPGMVPRSGPADQGSMLDSVLDPARRALAASSRVLFHIQGERLGYLRCLTLTTFDGARWSGPPRAPLKFIPYVAWEKLGNYSHRQVRVKNAAFLGRVLPVDGDVVFLYGRFFGRPMVNAHGGIETDSIWNTANNEYQYWIDPQPPATPLPRGLARLYVQHPEVSARITNWLDQVLVGATNSYDQARRLEHHLQTRFAYELGAPELNRANFTEEFLFEQRRGHCERFASALTLLLRVKGIPSRVVIGYLPTSRNSFSGGYNIRFRDAHAWTEAWFPERGWVTLDGTPRAQYPPEDWNVRDLLADLDFAWSAYVVNFDAPTQSQFLIGALQSLGQAPGWLARHWKPAVPVAGIALALGLWFRLGARRRVASPGAPHRRAQTQWAEHYYGQMLRALARAGLERQPHQTPLEFLNVLGQRPLPVLEDARRITDLFCATRYGGRVLSADQRAELQRALHQIRLTTLQAQSARTRPGKAEPPL